MTPKKNSYALACLVVFFAACGPRVITVAVGRANAPVEMVAASLGVSCALLSGGVIKCWGSNWVGALGLGDTSSRGDKPADIGLPFPPVDLGTEKKAVSVHAAGTYIGPDDHACAILDDGQLKCWGYNEFGELGLGDTNNRGDGPGEMGDNLPAVNLGTASVVKQMALGTSCACALLDGGKVKCWGFNTEGSLGIGDATNRGAQPADMGDNLPAVDLGTGLTAVSVSAGVEHVCAVLGTGQLKCWGSNRLGELGLGDTNNRGDVPGEMGDNLPAVDLGTGRSAVSVVAGFFHT